MAQFFTIVQRKQFSPKVYNRGIFTTKKIVWELWFMEEIMKNPAYQEVKFYDDVNKVFKEPTYAHLCNILTNNGRVCIFAKVLPKSPIPDDEMEDETELRELIENLDEVETEIQIAMITSAEKNKIRSWDIDEELNLIPNPVISSAEILDSETNMEGKEKDE